MKTIDFLQPPCCRSEASCGYSFTFTMGFQIPNQINLTQNTNSDVVIISYKSSNIPLFIRVMIGNIACKK